MSEALFKRAQADGKFPVWHVQKQSSEWSLLQTSHGRSPDSSLHRQEQQQEEQQQQDQKHGEEYLCFWSPVVRTCIQEELSGTTQSPSFGPLLLRKRKTCSSSPPVTNAIQTVSGSMSPLSSKFVGSADGIVLKRRESTTGICSKRKRLEIPSFTQVESQLLSKKPAWELTQIYPSSLVTSKRFSANLEKEPESSSPRSLPFGSLTRRSFGLSFGKQLMEHSTESESPPAHAATGQLVSLPKSPMDTEIALPGDTNGCSRLSQSNAQENSNLTMRVCCGKWLTEDSTESVSHARVFKTVIGQSVSHLKLLMDTAIALPGGTNGCSRSSQSDVQENPNLTKPVCCGKQLMEDSTVSESHAGVFKTAVGQSVSLPKLLMDTPITLPGGTNGCSSLRQFNVQENSNHAQPMCCGNQVMEYSTESEGPGHVFKTTQSVSLPKLAMNTPIALPGGTNGCSSLRQSNVQENSNVSQPMCCGKQLMEFSTESESPGHVFKTVSGELLSLPKLPLDTPVALPGGTNECSSLSQSNAEENINVTKPIGHCQDNGDDLRSSDHQLSSMPDETLQKSSEPLVFGQEADYSTKTESATSLFKSASGHSVVLTTAAMSRATSLLGSELDLLPNLASTMFVTRGIKSMGVSSLPLHGGQGLTLGEQEIGKENIPTAPNIKVGVSYSSCKGNLTVLQVARRQLTSAVSKDKSSAVKGEKIVSHLGTGKLPLLPNSKKSVSNYGMLRRTAVSVANEKIILKKGKSVTSFKAPRRVQENSL